MRFIILFFTAVFLLAADSFPHRVVLLERLSLVLTGELPPESMKKDYIAGKKNLLDIARELRNTEKFERHLAHFYQEKLKITEPVDFVRLYSLAIGDSGYDVLPKAKIHFKWRVVGGKRNVFEINQETPDSAIKKYADLLRNPQKHHPWQLTQVSRNLHYLKYKNPNHYIMKLFADQSTTTLQILEEGAEGYRNGKIIADDLRDDFAELLSAAQQAEFCHREMNLIEVNPYWDMRQTVLACPAVIKKKFCGENFRNCFPYGLAAGDLDENNFYRRKIAEAITLEPGRIMAKIVREDKKYSEILTTSKGLVNGHYQHFLRHFDQVIKKSYRKYTSNDYSSVLESPLNSYPEINSMQTLPLQYDPASGEDEYHWTERGSTEHAGILTTIAFHRSTNGWRAKANRTRSALLCREFVDPIGAKADPSDQHKPPSERKYCQNCHIYLDPMAKFFYRWPDTGNDNNYFYNHVAEVVNTTYLDTICGEDCQVAGEGSKGFAKILVDYKDDGFKKCAIEHAFEFIVKGSMLGGDKHNLMPSLLQVYNDNGERIWPVMEKIIEKFFLE